jgi:serine/threonine-protein kinase
MTTAAGTTTGSIRIEQSLKSGGSGSLLLGRQPALERLVAVRELPGELLEHPAVVERFRREARLGARIHHPNVVAVLDCFAYRGDHYLVLEYVDGPDLREILARAGSAPTAVALSFGLELARGLQALHARGIVHENLTPERILVSRWGEPKIRGLGLARERHEESPSRPAPSPYTAPELLAGESGDARSDVYALGAILYELLTESTPQEGNVRPRGAPRKLASLVARCLDPDPDRRPRSADAVRRELRRLASHPDPHRCRNAIVDWLYAADVLRPAKDARPEERPEEVEVRSRRGPSLPLAWGVAGAVAAAVALFSLLETLKPGDSATPIGSVPTEASADPEPQTPSVAAGTASVPLPPAQLRFVVHPWAQVEVGGDTTFLTPRAAPVEVPPGEHVILFRHPRLGTHKLRITVKPGEERVIRQVLPDESAS